MENKQRMSTVDVVVVMAMATQVHVPHTKTNV
jgi:hypothetical protein